MSPSPPRWILPAILALAVALRVLAWHGAVVMTNDGPDFLWQAGQLLQGDFTAALSHPYHPLYAVATALASPFTGSVLHAALAVSILSALAIVLAVRALAARLFPQNNAVPAATALLAAVHGRLAMTTADIQSDGLFLALAALACATLLAAAQRGGCRRRMGLAGLLTGLAYLARPEGLFLVGVAALWWILAVTRRATPATRADTSTARDTEAARATSGLALFLAGVAVCVLPYVVVLHELSGRWSLSLKPSVAAAGLGDASAGFPLPADCPLASPIVFKAPAGAVTAMPEGLRSAKAVAPTTNATPMASPTTTAVPAPATLPAAQDKPAADSPSAASSAAGASAAAPAAGEVRDNTTAQPGVVAGKTADPVGATASSAADESPGEAADEPVGGRGERGVLGALPPAALHAASVLLAALRMDTAVLVLVGLIVLWRTRRGLAVASLGLVGAWLVMVALHSWMRGGLSARHTLLATLLLLPMAGAGLVTLWALAGSWRSAHLATGRPSLGRRIAGLSLRIALVLALALHAGAGMRPRHVGSEARLAALAWAAEHSAPGERLAVHRRKDSYYGGRPVLVVNLPCFDAELVDKLQRHDVALLVLDERRVQRAAPHWLTGGRFAERARFGSGEDTVLVLELVRD